MSSSTANLRDAVRSDGTLKDASEIDWSFDADDSIPFPSVPLDSASASASASHTTFASTCAPATNVASVRQTTRVSHPSHWFIQDNSEEELQKAPTPKSSGIKRKVTSSVSNRPTKRKTINLVSDGNSDGDSDCGSPSPPPTELASDDYESLKAMADADNQAATTKPREERTANIHLLFYCKKEYIHPVTGKRLDGHWCKVCQADPSVKETSCFLTRSTILTPTLGHSSGHQLNQVWKVKHCLKVLSPERPGAPCLPIQG
ncbi:hypothetical protein EI94DRAFT_1710414 [Lactarius quietus]|nr:hypothetical protein EI94DRAFT_1710414 [Lactarius quietus]